MQTHTFSFRNIIVLSLFATVCLCTVFFTKPANGQSQSIVLQNDYVRYTIGNDGKNISFIDKKSGTDYIDRTNVSSFAIIQKAGNDYPVSSLTYKGNRITAKFGNAGIRAVFDVSVKSCYILLEITSVSGTGIDSILFLNIPLTLDGLPSDPYAACVLSLKLQTKVEQMPALQSHLAAECFDEFGITGGKIALIGVPRKDILPVIKEVMTAAEEIPHSTAGGAWAQDNPESFGSMLFNSGDLTPETVDEWIANVKSLGFTAIQNHGGRRSFRFGDFKPVPGKFPNGWDDFKAINDKLHKEGIGSIFHTYGFFIDKTSKYVTPVPHKDLGAFRAFTLAEPVDETATEIRVVESTADVSTFTGGAVRNSVTLHIGDELITFSGVTKEPPYTFTGCQRGACDTKPTSHKKGAKAHHLTQCFGLFAPAPGTELFNEIARLHAEIVDYCGFDGMYLDAIDAADLLDGREHAWYYATAFVFEIMKHLKKPVAMEYSSMYHHWWHFRPRWQAWDYPNRGHKRFVDLHIEHINRGLFLPLHLGWWNFQSWNPPQVEPSFSDVIEYLGCKMIGHNAGLTAYPKTTSEEYRKEYPLIDRAVGIVKRYEQLRHADYFDEQVKARLREPGKEFTMFKDKDDKWKFRPVHYDDQTVEGIGHTSRIWKPHNPFSEQPVQMRIEALMSVGAYDAPGNVTLTDFSAPNEFSEKSSAEGVTFDLRKTTDSIKTGCISGKLTALNSGKTEQRGAWTSCIKTFSPWIDLGKHQALGVWIHGDGQGELINFRIRCPQHISRVMADHYVIVDFKGWKYFKLVELESARHADYSWPEGAARYNMFRQLANFNHVETFAVMLNNLHPGKEVTCYISPVKALPLVPIAIKNPSVTINGKTITFPVDMESGMYLEYKGDSGCKLYGSKGELITNVSPQGDIPVLTNGSNEALFNCDVPPDYSVRAKVTIISHGEAL